MVHAIKVKTHERENHEREKERAIVSRTPDRCVGAAAARGGMVMSLSAR